MASKRLFYLRQLKYSGLTECDLLRVYKSPIRPICEYACPVWSTGLTSTLSEQIESIQKRALKTIRPLDSYHKAFEYTQLENLSERRKDICFKLFKDMENPSHRLHCLLPDIHENPYHLRNTRKYQLPKCKTNRYKNSFVPWCIANERHTK